MRHDRLNVLIISGQIIPSVHIGIMRPLIELEEQGHVSLRRIHTRVKLFYDSLVWCDVAIFCRATNFEELLIFYELKRLGKKVIYEVDDNFFEISKTTEIGRFHRLPENLYSHKQFLKHSDITRVFSDRMLLIASDIGANVIKSRLYFDFHALEGSKRPSSTYDSIVDIAYPTQRVDDPQLEVAFYRALAKVMKHYGSRVRFHTWNAKKHPLIAQFSNIVQHKPSGSYETFIRSFNALGIDIGLAPALDGPFYHSKTNNKFREFSACQIAGVFSDCPPYSNTISEDQGVLVANTEQAWFDGISFLIEDAHKRREIAKAAYKEVFENYRLSEVAEQYLMQLRSALDSSGSEQNCLPSWIPRLGSSPARCFNFSYIKGQNGSRNPEANVFSDILPTLTSRHLGATDSPIKAEFLILQFTGEYSWAEILPVPQAHQPIILDCSACNDVEVLTNLQVLLQFNPSASVLILSKEPNQVQFEKISAISSDTKVLWTVATGEKWRQIPLQMCYLEAIDLILGPRPSALSRFKQRLGAAGVKRIIGACKVRYDRYANVSKVVYDLIKFRIGIR